MLRNIKVLAASMAVLGAVSCSSSSSSDVVSKDGGTTPGTEGGGGGGSMSLSDFCTALITAEANAASTCFGGAASQYVSLETDENACAALAAAVAAKRITYDADSSGDCVAAYASLSCSDLVSDDATPASCTATLSGAVAKGGDCFSDTDCAESGVCELASSGCGGKCATRIAAGATCDPSTPDSCVTGYSCTATGAKSTCAKTAIAKTAAAGKPCGEVGSTLVSCEAGLVCNEKTDVCQAFVVEGGDCTPGADVCATFSYCADATKKCTGDATEGEACGIATGQTEYIPCLGATYCKTATGSEAGKCTALGATGATCTEGDACLGTCSMKSGATTGTCVAPCTTL